MNLNRREAQRVRITQLHDHRDRPAAAPLTTTTMADSAPAADAIAGGWGQLSAKFQQWWTHRSEPRVTAMTDPSGHLWWRAYNPRTHELKWLASDTEVMLWLSSQPWF